MKGAIEGLSSFVMKVVIALIVIAIGIGALFYSGFFGEATGQEAALASLCPRWVAEECTCGSMTTIESPEGISVYEACDTMFGEEEMDTHDLCVACKGYCLGCPK